MCLYHLRLRFQLVSYDTPLSSIEEFFSKIRIQFKEEYISRLKYLNHIRIGLPQRQDETCSFLDLRVTIRPFRAKSILKSSFLSLSSHWYYCVTKAVIRYLEQRHHMTASNYIHTSTYNGAGFSPLILAIVGQFPETAKPRHLSDQRPVKDSG